MSAYETFAKEAPGLMAEMMHKFDLSEVQAAGIAGNIGRESLGFTCMREIGAPPGRGGYGLAQWTGPRARLYLNWCTKNCVKWNDIHSSIGYLTHELSTNYAYIIHHLRECETVDDSTRVFEQLYERAGVPAMRDRIAWAKRALAAYRETFKDERAVA